MLVFLFFFEVMVRLLFPQLGLSADIRQPDPVLHHALTPRAKTIMHSQEFRVQYQINSIGLRDHEIGPKQPGTYRILVVGDSVVEGWGVEIGDTWEKQLEKKLNEQIGGKRFEVINTGVASYSPLLYYLYLKDKGLALQPDMVIMMMDMADPSDDYAYTKISRFSGGLPTASPGGYYQYSGWRRWLGKADWWVRRWSRLYLLGDVIISSQNQATRGLRPMPFDLKKTPSWQSGWRLSQRYILLSRDMLQEKDIPFVLTVNPPAFLVGPDEWTVGRKMMQFDLKGIDFDQFFKDFDLFAQRNGITYIDMLGYLRSYPEHPLYYSYDIHPNQLGHRVIADKIFKEMINNVGLGKVPQ